MGFRPDEDLIFEISDKEMLPILHRLQSEEGIAVGVSAQVNYPGADD